MKTQALLIAALTTCSTAASAACMPDSGVCISTAPYVAHGAPAIGGGVGGAAGMAAGMMGAYAIGSAIGSMLVPQGPDIPPEVFELNANGNRWANKGWRYLKASDCRHAVPMFKNSLPFYQRALLIEPDEIIAKNLRSSQNGIAGCQKYIAKLKAEAPTTKVVATSQSNDTPDNCKTGAGGTRFFGTGGNPSGAALDCGAPSSLARENQTVTAPTARDQAASAAKDGQTATTANSVEAMKETAGCGFAGAPCRKGDPVTLPRIGGVMPTRVAVFPEIAPQDWSKLQSSKSGRALIKQADELLSRRIKLERTIDEIRSGGYARDRQQDWISADKELQEIRNELSGYQKKAQDLIKRTVLD
jgi:hypothetical protein